MTLIVNIYGNDNIEQIIPVYLSVIGKASPLVVTKNIHTSFPIHTQEEFNQFLQDVELMSRVDGQEILFSKLPFGTEFKVQFSEDKLIIPNSIDHPNGAWFTVSSYVKTEKDLLDMIDPEI